MIFVSSSSIRTPRIGEAVRTLAGAGFRHIELSGGTTFYEGWKDELLDLKSRFHLDYRLHNYFPPPREPFILNLASLDDAVYERSLDFYCQALKISRDLGAKRFGFHAGFFFDPQLKQLGRSLDRSVLFDREQAFRRFIDGVNRLKAEAGEIQLYIENHVFSRANADTFGEERPLMFLTASDFEALQPDIGVRPLVDLAHLHVTCVSLNLNFDTEARTLLAATDYIHLSGNDGSADSNDRLNPDSPVLAPLKSLDLNKYTVTLEVYDGLNAVRSSFETVMNWNSRGNMS